MLRKAGLRRPVRHDPQERREALQKADPAHFGIYEAEVQLFLQYMDDMEKVRAWAACT